jgi:hypothetical protein
MQYPWDKDDSLFFEYISKKPLIPNTTKALKTKKIKISKQI